MPQYDQVSISLVFFLRFQLISFLLITALIVLFTLCNPDLLEAKSLHLISIYSLVIFFSVQVSLRDSVVTRYCERDLWWVFM